MLLSANLDGQGNLRLSDPQTILAQVGGSSPTLAEAQALARKLHAGAVLYGGLVRAGGVVRADLTLYRADSSVALATLSASASPDSISALTDTLAWGLLRQIWRGRDAPTPSVAAVTTRSWPAMRAFLKGEAAFAAYRMQEAEDAYLAAVEADSTLWLAWYRLNYIRSAYMLRPADTAIRNRVEAHLDELPDRERRMLEVPKMTREDAALDRRSSSRARFQAILRDYPDYWWGWWVLADNSFHTGGLIYGTSPEETIAELRRTVELNPSFVPAWAHLAQALYLRDSVGWAAAVAGGGDVPPEAPWMGEAKGWADPTVETLPDLSGLRAAIAAAPAQALDPRMGYWMAAGAPQLATIVLPELARDPRGERIHDDTQRARAWAWASRGAWDSALAVVGSIREGRPLDGYRLAAIGGWIGGVPDEVVATWKRELDAVRASLSPRDRAEAEWLDGLDASAAGDSAGVSSAAARVRKGRGSERPTPRARPRDVRADSAGPVPAGSRHAGPARVRPPVAALRRGWVADPGPDPGTPTHGGACAGGVRRHRRGVPAAQLDRRRGPGGEARRHHGCPPCVRAAGTGPAPRGPWGLDPGPVRLRTAASSLRPSGAFAGVDPGGGAAGSWQDAGRGGAAGRMTR